MLMSALPSLLLRDERRSRRRVKHFQVVDIVVEPLPDNHQEPLFLVVFCDVGAPLGHHARKGSNHSLIALLFLELLYIRSS